MTESQTTSHGESEVAKRPHNEAEALRLIREVQVAGLDWGFWTQEYKRIVRTQAIACAKIRYTMKDNPLREFHARDTVVQMNDAIIALCKSALPEPGVTEVKKSQTPSLRRLIRAINMDYVYMVLSLLMVPFSPIAVFGVVLLVLFCFSILMGFLDLILSQGPLT